MPVDARLLDLMTDTATIGRATSWNAHGEPVHGSATSYKCRYVRETRAVRGPNGDEVLSSAQVILETSVPAMTVDDLVTVVGVGSSPIVSLKHHRDEHGHHHTTVYLA